MFNCGWSPYYVRFDQTDLEAEWYQCRDEGKILPRALREEFERLRSADLNDVKEQNALLALMDKCGEVPVSEEYDYIEPSDLDAIRAARPTEDCLIEAFDVFDTEALEDRVRGAWYGRSAGCLLGTPVEGWTGERVEDMLKETGRYPLTGYMRLSGVDEAIRTKYDFAPGARWVDTVPCMPEDDDMNYTLVGLGIMREHGANFTPLNVAEYWLRFLPPWRTCTAERIAIRNLMLAKEPPETALYRNPYREWIGAQIRADFFGWAGAGNPVLAAEWAWRDASISHIKNGIYGEMWVAAMLAAAATTQDVQAVLCAGLNQIPEWSRLQKAVRNVMSRYRCKCSYDEFVSEHRRRWKGMQVYGWVHTIANAELVTAALLWGEGDFTKSLCMAVQPGYDTDCNGATVGSIMGTMLGAKRIPEEWIRPLGGHAIFTLAGVEEMTYDRLVSESVSVIQKVRA
ncbi:MAG: ADP-ribosylglycohydrolase family protein [Candidatus Sumerlaeales bacterium]|nr:ADP-ribosylglycohydrolase family protein [Candidatus Sumerlaeales bacterium]